MACHPTSQESLAALHRLRQETLERGDECLSVILAGVELYVSLGKELELLEHMSEFAHDIRESVENTPSAKDLERLFRMGEAERGQ